MFTDAFIRSNRNAAPFVSQAEGFGAQALVSASFRHSPAPDCLINLTTCRPFRVAATSEDGLVHGSITIPKDGKGFSPSSRPRGTK